MVPEDLIVDVLGGSDDFPGRLVELARDHPAVVDSGTGIVLALRYHEIDRLAHDRRTHGVGLSFFDLMGIEGGLRDWYSSLMFTNEGDPHARLRRLVSRAFTPRSVERLRDHARELVASAMLDLTQAGGGDLIEAFRLVPIRVICRLLGVPEEDSTVFGAWADALSPVFAFMEPEQILAAEKALGELLGYVSDLAETRSSSPADDLITGLLGAEDDGDSLTREEVVTMVANLLVAGHDTTSSQLGCSFLTLLRHPSALKQLRAGRVTPGHAVAETMRVEPNIAAIPRQLVEPVEVGGVTRPAGTVLLLAVYTGNRDPDVYEHADTFIVDRFASDRTPPLLSFGSGPHYCLGANLARMTLHEGVQTLAARNVTLLTDPDRVEWRTVLGRSPASLPVRIA